MSLLDSKPPASGARDVRVVCLQLASLLCTGFFIWKTASTAHWLQLSLRWLMLQSAIAALAAWIASAAISITLYAIFMQGERTDQIKTALRTSAVAIWFAPAVILLSQLSPVALAGALVLVIYTARLLYFQWRAIHPPLDFAISHAPEDVLFTQLTQPNSWKDRAPALTASFCIQTGVVATLFHYPLLAGIGYAMSAAVITVYALSAGVTKSERPPTLPRSILGVLATILLAAGLTVGGLVPRMMRSYGWGESIPQQGLIDTARAFLRELLYGERPGGAPQGLPGLPNPLGTGKRPGGRPNNRPNNYGVPDDPRTGFGDEGFPGVILWPEVKPIPTLIAPMPQLGSGLFTSADMHPLSIPFSGEYWMFRWPEARPPKSSYFQRGNPATLSFSTTDHRPMQMEAHHKLQQTVDLNCCSQIQLAIRNADRFPGTVTVELFLLNSEVPNSRAESLGRALVVSMPDTTKEPVTPVADILKFAMPTAPALDAFDEFKIVFDRDRRRMDKSAKIAIDRFILVPR